MSLINEALKKAQRDRHLENLPPSPDGSPRTARRANGPSKSILILLGTGIIALFVVAVVGTVLFINREPAPKPVVAKAPALSPPAVATAPAIAPAPIIAAPVATPPPTPATATSTAPAIVVAIPPATTAPAVVSEPAAAPAASTPVLPSLKVSPPPPAPAADKFDARLQTMVDGWHVNLVRAAGADSRLFMNGNVYRIGDVIDRASGLRLTEVSTSTLTFTDASGSTYLKRH